MFNEDEKHCRGCYTKIDENKKATSLECSVKKFNNAILGIIVRFFCHLVFPEFLYFIIK